MTKLRWGVLGAARIATTKVIPAMKQCEFAEVVAIASRDLEKGKKAAADLGIERAYGSYEELLADPEIDCIYNPLPNHLHVSWSVRAAEAGKHVLCEKPIALSVADCRHLIRARDRMNVRVSEAFMVRTHPQWLRARELVQSGAIGDLKAMLCAFSYFNRDPANVRNVLEWGGGALMDIGCYPIHVARFLFQTEPVRVSAAVERDPDFKIDRLSSGLLQFPQGHCAFTTGTQLVPYQRVQIMGTTGRVEIEIPFNAPPDRPCRLWVDRGGELFGSGISAEEFETCNQYTIQADLFSRAVLEGTEVPTPLEDSIRNMAVIEALFRSAAEGVMVRPEPV